MSTYSIDRPEGGESAVLVHIYFSAEKMQEDLNEFKELCISSGAHILTVVTGTRSVPDSKYFIGKGKAEEVRDIVRAQKAQLVIFNHALSPAQERNLERLFQCRVIDRIGLILDIFAQRARSFEGKLQVELALLRHLSTRLVRGWTHLERQRGGIGLRGPGETQLETDRRLIRARIKYISERLQKVEQQREQSRHARERSALPTIALVGYTNAGKSTLFNTLTGADVYVADRLFATLDPTLRCVKIRELGEVIFADTVGFIRHLPHELIKAFQATLEEVAKADLLLHVVDASDERRLAFIEQVNSVLERISAQHVPQLFVYNKIDLCSLMKPGIVRAPDGRIYRVHVSAKENLGLQDLEIAIKESIGEDLISEHIILNAEDARLRAKLYHLSAVVSEKILDDGRFDLYIRLPKDKWDQLKNSQKSQEILPSKKEG